MGIKLRKPKFTKSDAAIPIGGVSASVINGLVHEGGHYLAATALGYNPSFGYDRENVFGLRTYISRMPESTLDDKIIVLGAPAAELTSAFALSVLSGGIKNPFLRYSAKMTSTFLGMAPFIETLLSYFLRAGNDYQKLAQSGIGYEITIPATFAMGLMNAYVAWKDNLSSSRRHTP